MQTLEENDNMKQSFKFFIGLALIAAGVLWILNILGVLCFEFSTRGWWTLFIIIPCLCALFSDNDKVGPCIGLGIGVLLLLAARDIIDWSMMWQMALAVIVIGLGVQLLFINSSNSGCCHKSKVYDYKTISREGKDIRSVTSSFGKQYLSFSGEKFDGAEVDSSFGALTLDLRGAIVEGETFIDLNVSFSGVTIIVPDGMAVKVAVTSGFGGVSDNRRLRVQEGSPVVILTGSVGFGGVEIKN